jgi:hypothetical protein
MNGAKLGIYYQLSTAAVSNTDGASQQLVDRAQPPEQKLQVRLNLQKK